MTAMWRATEGDGPIVVTAIHNGHKVREEIGRMLAISDGERLREEDPFTGIWTDIAGTSIVADFSRFQVDLNRPRETAVYIRPEDAWGLHVWKEEPSRELIERSLQEYDHFYSEVHGLFSNLVDRHGRIVVLDLHTYNHRREGSDGPIAKREENPEVNVGTGSMNRDFWGAVVDRFIHDLSSYDFLGRQLDVRENVKFRGGQFSRWAHSTFPESVGVLAVEVKKFFMDEWSGALDQITFSAVHKALDSTIPGILEVLGKMGRQE